MFRPCGMRARIAQLNVFAVPPPRSIVILPRMSTALKRLSFVARVATQRAPCRRPRRYLCPPSQPRSFSTTTTLRRQNVPDDDESLDPFPARTGELADGEDEEAFPEELLEVDRDDDEYGIDAELERIESDEDELAKDPFEEDLASFEPEADEEPRWPPGFFSMDEDRDDPGEDPEFENDDITSTAHGELEQHRELREFARVMVWDMPLLFNHARAFEVPTAAQPLRFRYTTYMGETHPASRKVVMTFSPSALPDLSEIQISKLIKLLGVRYNPSTTSAKLSCEHYSTAAQNKRYLCDLLDTILTEAKDTKDTFEDVPFDFRHHKPKKRYLFPEEWKLTDERRKALEARREEKKALEERKTLQGNMVHGTLLIEERLRPAVQSEKEAVMQVATGTEQKGRQQKRRQTRF